MRFEMETLNNFINELVKQSDEFIVQLNAKTFIKIAVGSAAAISLIYFGKIWMALQFFRKRGIPTPKYNFIFGNLFELRKTQNDSTVVQEWTKKYGKTYGYYEGHVPILVTSDLDIIQEVFIKQYNNFSARKRAPLQKPGENKELSLILSAKGKWKRMRLIMNPTFSSAKLKEMSPLIIKCVDRLNQCLNGTTMTEINVSNYLKRFTMDTIWNCAFGLDIDLQNNPDNEYFKKSENLFLVSQKLTVFALLSVLFHEFNPIIYSAYAFFNKIKSLFGKEDPRFWLLSKVGYLIEKRKQENIYKKDYMQLLLDAQSDHSFKDNDHMNLSEMNNIIVEKKLSIQEVEANLVMFMNAGYETTSNSLGLCCFVLARHQEEQQKLIDEIDSNFPPHDTNIQPDTENIKSLTYLDNFIREVLRIYPIARVIRRCVSPTTIKDISITPEMLVRIDVLSIHMSPELWGPVDPNLFYPPRHQDNRNPMAYLSFGIGPRNCIGMKFAWLEMKLALVNLLRNYEVHPSDNTPTKLEFVEGIVRSPINGINVTFKKRIFN